MTDHPPLAGPDRDRSVLARFPGTCEACGLQIDIGSLIERDGREWIHADCKRERDEAAAMNTNTDQGGHR